MTDDLEVGDQILALAGGDGVVERVVIVAQVRAVYDLTVGEVHTFVVGDGEWGRIM